MQGQKISKLNTGDILPSFVLGSIDGILIPSNIFAMKKNLVLFFFHHLCDETGQYLQKLNDAYLDIQGRQAEILAACREREAAIVEFYRNKKIRFNILSDPEGAVISEFTLNDDDGLNIPALFIASRYYSLSKQYAKAPFGNGLPEADEILSELDSVEKRFLDTALPHSQRIPNKDEI
jgi:peroxiredoxin